MLGSCKPGCAPSMMSVVSVFCCSKEMQEWLFDMRKRCFGEEANGKYIGSTMGIAALTTKPCDLLPAE